MEEEKTINKICYDVVSAFKEFNNSVSDGTKAVYALLDSTMKNAIAEAFLNESKWMEKWIASYWFTRWYYRIKYRKAKYARINIERFYNQNFQ